MPPRDAGRDHYRLSALLSCLASHLVAWLQSAFAFPLLELPARWHGQFAVLLLLSAALGAAHFALGRRLTAPLPLLLARLLLFAVATYPLGEQITIRVTLLSALVFEAMIYLEPPGSWLFAVAAVGAAVLLQRPVLAWEGRTSRLSTEGLLFLAFYPTLVMILGAFLKQSQRMAAERKRLLDRLRQASTNLVETNLTLQDHVIAGDAHARLLEWQRISRELHDTIGYTLMNIIAVIKASLELSRTDPERMRRFLDQTVEQAQRGLAETRAALRAMRVREERPVPLVTSLSRLATAFKETHIQVALVFSSFPGSFDEETDATIYRMVQEGIANAIRHGNATSITVYVAVDGPVVNITVSDNGCGAAEVKEGIGLAGIRERLRKLGGQLEATNAAAGFRLHARIPLPTAAEAPT